MDLIGWKLLEPSAGGVGEEEWQLSDDGSIVSPSASQLTSQPKVCQPQLWFCFTVVLRDAGRGSERAGQRRAVDCPAEHPWTWWLWGHLVLVAVVPPAAMGTVTALFRVPVPTSTILFNVASRVVSTLVVDGEDERGLFPSRGLLLMDRHLLFILGWLIVLFSGRSSTSRSRAFGLLNCRHLEQSLYLISDASAWEFDGSGMFRSSIVAATTFWTARGKRLTGCSGSASPTICRCTSRARLRTLPPGG